jgi:hypothetical protein
MKRYITKTAWLAAALLVVTATLPVQAGKGNQGNPGILPPQSLPNDKSYGEWAAAWWQWAFAIPTPMNPLADTTGEFASVGQQGPVWFLAGVWGANYQVVRECTVPADKMLFFPIANWVTAGWQFTGPEDVAGFVVWARGALKDAADQASGMACEIDGTPVLNIDAYREQSGPFPLTFPVDNLWGHPEWQLELQTDVLGMDEGYYLMLAPLKPGTHTIHFQAGSMDVTYHLTVL